MRSVLVRNFEDLDERRGRRGPTKQCRTPGGQTWEFPQESPQSVGYEPLHQILVSVVDEAMQEKCVAL